MSTRQSASAYSPEVHASCDQKLTGLAQGACSSPPTSQLNICIIQDLVIPRPIIRRQCRPEQRRKLAAAMAQTSTYVMLLAALLLVAAGADATAGPCARNSRRVPVMLTLSLYRACIVHRVHTASALQAWDHRSAGTSSCNTDPPSVSVLPDHVVCLTYCGCGAFSAAGLGCRVCHQHGTCGAAIPSACYASENCRTTWRSS